jgi:Mn2+/Fe2+ NRAMP family transporter
VVNGLVAPVVLWFILRLSTSKKVMGEWKNAGWRTFIGWLTLIFMAASGLAAIFVMIKP